MRWFAVLALSGCFSTPRFDGAGADAGSGSDAGDGGLTDSDANLIFVSSTKVAPNSIGGITGADAFCQTIADTKGFDGQFIAWMSTSTSSAISRLGTASGWMRPDKKPVANSIGDLVAGKHFYPPRLDENGNDIGPDADAVMTATTVNGVVYQNGSCDDLQGAAGNISYGHADAAGYGWTFVADDNPCNRAARVYCLGVSKSTQVTVARPAESRLAFVSTGTFLPDDGMTAFDMRCNSEAAVLPGQPTAVFRAALPTNTESIQQRFANGSPWARADGVVVIDGGMIKMTAPISTAADGTFVGGSNGVSVIGGTTGWSASSTNTCDNWSSNSAGTFNVGWSARSVDDGAFVDETRNCNANNLHVYCLQQ